jgi:predicted lipoprotein
MIRSLILSLCLATPALADFPEAVNNHILRGYAAFADTTQALSDQAAKSCAPETLYPAFNAAYDAWIGIQHIHFGPVERLGRSLAIEYWPDPKGSGAKSQRALLMGDPALLSPERFVEQSVAARGLSGLERLLYPASSLPADPCLLIRATTFDLAFMAKETRDAWVSDYAKIVLTAGETGNAVYLARKEVRQEMFTQVIAGLEFIIDQRLARPLGTFDKPHPERAESVASGRSLRNVLLSLQALRAMVETLTPDVPKTIAAFDRAIDLAENLDDPAFAGVATPQGRLRVEILQQSVTALRDTALAELGPELDVGIGFNAADGD